MSDVVIFDTSVLVDEARTGRHRKKIESVEGVIRMSSVVLAELLRGVGGRRNTNSCALWRETTQS
jgi:predicted nucleic acid-binding protein